MYFDLEDYRPDITPVGQAISWREGILLSIIGHMAMFIFLMLSPKLFPDDPAADAERLRLAAANVKPPQEQMRFVFVDPKVDLEALRAPERAPLSDKNRVARSPEAAPVPPRPVPLSRGNTPERVERTDAEAARGRGPGPDPSLEPKTEPPTPTPNPTDSVAQPKLPESQSAMALPPTRPAAPPSRVAAGGALGDALRNLERYVKPGQYDNPQGGAQFGPIQFDTKGVEFGPWVRRFAAQVKRNWDPLIPNGPMMMRKSGHVVITLNVHKSGAITDVTVAGPCPIEGFNTAAFGALTASNPTQPLPPEYPADRAFFTITFFYNERPPEQ